MDLISWKLNPSKGSNEMLNSHYQEKFWSAVRDDLNTPILIAHLFEGVRIINIVNSGKETLDQKSLEKMKHIFKVFVN